MNLLALAMLSPMVAAILAPSSAPQDPEAAEVIGYQYSCSAEVAVGSAKLHGGLTLQEDGTRDGFSAQYYGEEDEIHRLFFLQDWGQLKRRGIESHVRWSLVWDIRNLASSGMNRLPRFEGASLRLSVSTRRKLPKMAFLTLSTGDHMSSGMIAESYRWEGRPTGAEFSFPLGEVLGFKGEASGLKWRLLAPPLPTGWAYSSNRLRAEGRVELDPVRKLEQPFLRLREALLAKAADHKQACARIPVLYDPLSEI